MKKDAGIEGLFKIRFAFLATLAGKLRGVKNKIVDIDSISISKIDVTNERLHYNYKATIIGRQKNPIHPLYEGTFIHQDECLWESVDKLSPALRRKLKK